METVTSVKTIEMQYGTGEEPVLVVCSDRNRYVCKYMRSSASAFKLACELSGAMLAKEWELPSPQAAFVKIKHEHWTPACPLNLSAPMFGSRKMDSVIDVTRTTSSEIPCTEKLQRQIMKIALFDIWTANEDRNWNNANLLYDVMDEDLIVIDHGCIFNTATFDYPVCQLTTTDSILASDLARALLTPLTDKSMQDMTEQLREDFDACTGRCEKNAESIAGLMPDGWHVKPETVVNKLGQLAEPAWKEGCWDNFMEYLNDNRNG
ncbi:MAG: hypothetical protein J6K19_09630 [Prevotella sp.]|nr:hypothetical protein [Prevotella sp.]